MFADCFPRRFAKDAQHYFGCVRVRLAGHPGSRKLVQKFEVVAAGTIGFDVAAGRVASFVVQQGIGELTKNRFGVMPADDFEGAEAVGQVDLLVPDIAKIARRRAA